MQELETTRPTAVSGRRGNDREDLELLRSWLRRVRRRIVLGRLVRAAVSDAAWSLAGFGLLLLVDRLALPGLASWAVLVAVLAVSATVSAARTLALAARDPFSIAVIADRRLGTKERLSSAAFAMALDEREDESDEDRSWHELVSRDARLAVSGVRLPEAFPVGVPRTCIHLLVAAAACASLSLWMPRLDWLGLAARRAGVEEMRRAVDEELRSLDERLEELEAKAEREEANEAREILRRVREASRRAEREGLEPVLAGSTEERRAPKADGFVRLGRVEEGLREGLRTAGFADLERTLEGLRRLDAEAGRDDSLRRKLAEGRLREAQAALAALAESARSLGRESGDPAAPADRDGIAEAGRDLASLARELSEKLPASSELARRLARAARSARAGTPADLERALALSEAELRRLADLADQADILDRALAEVQARKDALAALKECPVCGMPYCKDCGKPRCGCKVGAKPGGT